MTSIIALSCLRHHFVVSRLVNAKSAAEKEDIDKKSVEHGACHQCQIGG
jgi:hypothetical protein